MALKRDKRGDVVVAARLRDKEHSDEIAYLEQVLAHNPGTNTQDLMVWVINQARGHQYDIQMPPNERAAQETLKRVDLRTRKLEDLVVKLLTVIKNGGVNVNQEPQFTVEDRDLLRNMERASRDGMGDLGEFDL